MNELGPGAYGGVDDPGVEDPARNAVRGVGQLGGHLAAERAAQEEPLDGHEAGRDIGDAEGGELGQRMRGNSVATRLVTWEGCRVHQRHAGSGPGLQGSQCSRTPGRSGTDDNEVEPEVGVRVAGWHSLECAKLECATGGRRANLEKVSV